MSRNRTSAKRAGARFETDIAAYLAARVDARIHRAHAHGSKDRGDVDGVRFMGMPIVVECKDTARVSLPEWTDEAHVEAGNADALVGVVVHKRVGTRQPGEQWVSMTVDDLVLLLTFGKPFDTP